jgi:hypothetical protein
MKKILILSCLTLSLCSKQMCAGQEFTGRTTTGQVSETSKLDWKLYGPAGTKLTDALFTLQRMGEAGKAEALAADYDKNYRAIVSEKAINDRTDIKEPAKKELIAASKEKREKLNQKLRQDIFDAEMILFDTLINEPKANQSKLIALMAILQDISAPTTDNKKKLTNMRKKFAAAQKAGAFDEIAFEETAE